MFKQFPETARIQFAENLLEYKDLKQNFTAILKQLENLNIEAGDVVLVAADNTPALILALLAGIELELCLVPIDPQLKFEEVEKIYHRVQPRSFIFCGAEAIWESLLVPSKIFLSPSGSVAKKTVEDHKGQFRKLLGTVCIQFTSGSTGIPKGLQLSKENMYWRAENIRRALNLTAIDRTLCTVPLSHSHGIDCLAFPTLMAGGLLSLKNPSTAYPYRILGWIESEQITFFSSVPGMYDQFNRLVSERKYNLKTLRHAFCGSAALAEETAVQFEKKYGVRIKQGYGLAEIAVISLNLHNEQPITYESIGKPIDGVQYRIADDGELFVKSKSLFLGYLDNPSETAERLKKGELSTRDLVSEDSRGQLFLIGRKDDFINVLGQKVFPVEIENALASFPGLQDFCVIAEPDPARTEVPALHAVAESSDQDKLDEMEKSIIAHLRPKLEAYKIPQKIYWHPRLPKSPLGKILRSKLKGS